MVGNYGGITKICACVWPPTVINNHHSALLNAGAHTYANAMEVRIGCGVPGKGWTMECLKSLVARFAAFRSRANSNAQLIPINMPEPHTNNRKYTKTTKIQTLKTKCPMLGMPFDTYIQFNSIAKLCKCSKLFVARCAFVTLPRISLYPSEIS